MAPPEREARVAKPASASAEHPNPDEGRTDQAETTATEYVARMDISSERRAAALALAGRFEDKLFLADLCGHSEFLPDLRHRGTCLQGALGGHTRIFKFVAAMEAADIQRLLDEDTFSGPARLGPLAEAIRRNGRAARRRDADGGCNSETDRGTA